MKWQYKVLELTEHSSDPITIEKAINEACDTNEGWKVCYIDNDPKAAWYRVLLERHIAFDK